MSVWEEAEATYGVPAVPVTTALNVSPASNNRGRLKRNQPPDPQTQGLVEEAVQKSVEEWWRRIRKGDKPDARLVVGNVRHRLPRPPQPSLLSRVGL